jgi:hypothetical protein
VSQILPSGLIAAAFTQSVRLARMTVVVPLARSQNRTVPSELPEPKHTMAAPPLARTPSQHCGGAKGDAALRSSKSPVC